jgi:hypothetical protein
MGSKRGIFLSFLGKLPFLGSQGQIAKLRRNFQAGKTRRWKFPEISWY